MENIKMAFFDLDGTVIDPKTHQIPQDNIDSINALHNKGIKCIVCTGRSYMMIKDLAGLNKIHWDAYITNNGAGLYDSNFKQLNMEYFTTEQVEAIIEKCRRENMGVTIVCDDCNIAPLGCDDYMIEAYSFFNEPLPELIKPYQNEKTVMMLAFNKMDYDFYSFNKEIENIQAFPNHSTYADLVLKNISKAYGMKKACEYFMVSQKETIAFGDGNNDLEMLKYANIGIAMGNASADLKAIATYITSDVDKNGIYKALKYYSLL